MSSVTSDKRRDYGDGSISERSDGWFTASVSYRDPLTGERVRPSKTAKTRAAAVRALKDLRAQRDQGLSPLGAKERMPDFLERWLGTLKPEPYGNYSPRTIHGYGLIVERYLTPRLARVTIGTLNADHVQGLQDALEDNGLSSQTILNVRNVLSKAVRFAMRRRLLALNPLDLVEAPRASRGRGQVLEPADVRRFLDAIAGHCIEAAFFLELALGLRRAEVLGLTWAAVDLRTPGRESIRIDLTQIYVPKNSKWVRDTGQLFKGPKSARGARTLALPQRIVPMLHGRRELQIMERATSVAPWRIDPKVPRDLVFSKPDGSPYRPDQLTREVKSVLRSIGLGHLRGHDLRHSANSILQARGLPPLAAMHVMGHSTPDMSLGVYGHLLDESRLQARDIMNEFLDEVAADG